MRAFVTTDHGDREVLQLVSDYPEPHAQIGEVVVKVAACALNFHDIFTRRGMPGIRIKLPIVVGSDIAGTIETVGGDVHQWKPGDRVLVDPVLHGTIGMVGETVDGGRAERVKVSAGQLIAVPDDVSLDDAACIPLAYGTAYRMMIDRGRIRAGERILILGASGGVGAACVQLAKMMGCKVIACASTPSKLDRLAAIGADHLIDYSKDSMLGEVQRLFGKPRLTGDGGVDVAVNFTGGETWRDTHRCVRQGGRILNCGATAGYDVRLDLRFLWSFEQHVIGSNGWTKDGLVALVDLIKQQRLKPLIDCILPLEQAAEAERMLEDREVVGKILIKP